MKIISTNIGEPKTIEWRGKSIQTGIYKYPVPHPLFLGKEDVENDHVIDRRYHGGIDKACYLYSADHYKYWQQLYPDLDMPFGMFGENLTVEGLHEAEINIGDVFSIGEAVVQATQPRQPCFKLEFRFGNPDIQEQFINSGFPGVYLRVLIPGKVNTGHEMIIKDKKDSLSIRKVFELLYTQEFQKDTVLKAINDPHIAKSCRNDLLKRWGKEL